MRIKIEKSTAKGIINAQPSKSYSHRLLIAAALSNEECIIENVVLSNDIITTINCLKTLKKEIIINNSTVTIKTLNEPLEDELIFDCYESGSTLRFMIPVAALTGKRLIFKGTKKLISRGIGPFEEILKQQGFNIEIYEEKIIIEGKLQSGIFNIVGNISSQFISGLLLSLPLLKEDSIINLTTKLESKNYVDMTIDVLRQAGIDIKQENNKYYIKGSSKYNKGSYLVEGDYSNSAFLDAFNYLNGNVIINNLKEDSLQGDKIYKELFKLLDEKYQIIDISNCIDLGPILFVFSSLKHGAHFINTSRLKIKESDRISDLKEELLKFGIEVIDRDNEVIINNQNIHNPIRELEGHNDHRIVMALSIMLTVYGGVINGTNAVKKSYPSFFKDLEKLGIEVKYE